MWVPKRHVENRMLCPPTLRGDRRCLLPAGELHVPLALRGRFERFLEIFGLSPRISGLELDVMLCLMVVLIVLLQWFGPKD